VQLVALCVLPAVAFAKPAPKAKPKPDPLRPPADAQPKPPSSKARAAAKIHYTRALTLFDKKQYEAARKELDVAYATAPDADLLYAMSLVDKELDRCEDEITELQKFLETPHGPSATKAANDEIDRCKIKLAPPPPPPPPPPPVVKVAPPVAPPWYRDWIGDGLAGTGVVSGLVGLLCYRSAVSDLDAADKAMTLPEHARLVDDAHSMRTYALVFGAAGIALVTAGVVHYRKHARATESHVAVIPLAGGGMIGLSGSLP
jgi:tetratricopeptide (TPR) repeat protein